MVKLIFVWMGFCSLHDKIFKFITFGRHTTSFTSKAIDARAHNVITFYHHSVHSWKKYEFETGEIIKNLKPCKYIKSNIAHSMP